MPAEAAPSVVWVEAIPQAGSRITLDVDESHYLARVCRAREGEGVTLTDGRGARAQATVAAIGEQVVVEVRDIERIAAKRTAAILVGAPERGRADWMVEKLAELGVGTLQPIDTERSHWSRREVRLDRWRRVARAALRQSRRSFELEVREPVALSAALALWPKGAARFLADAEGTPAWRMAPPPEGLAVALVGPAEGFSAGERAQVASAAHVGIALSDARLRTETAALALASWWSAGG